MKNPYEKEDSLLERVSKEPNPGEPPRKDLDPFMMGAVVVGLVFFIGFCIVMFNAASESKSSSPPLSLAEQEVQAEMTRETIKRLKDSMAKSHEEEKERIRERYRREAEERRRWTHPKGKVSIVFPEDWDVTPTKGTDNAVQAKFQDEAKRLHLMNLMVEPSEAIDLWKLAPKELYERLGKGYKYANYDSFGWEKLAELNGGWIRLKSKEPEMLFTVYGVYHDGSLITLTCGVGADDDRLYKKVSSVFEMALASMKIPAK